MACETNNYRDELPLRPFGDLAVAIPDLALPPPPDLTRPTPPDMTAPPPDMTAPPVDMATPPDLTPADM